MSVYILTGLAATPTIDGCCRMMERGDACGGAVSFKPTRGIQLCDTHSIDWLRENAEQAAAWKQRQPGEPA